MEGPKNGRGLWCWEGIYLKSNQSINSSKSINHSINHTTLSPLSASTSRTRCWPSSCFRSWARRAHFRNVSASRSATLTRSPANRWANAAQRTRSPWTRSRPNSRTLTRCGLAGKCGAEPRARVRRAPARDR